MTREITRGGYSILGSVALLAAMACLGAASVAVQLGGVGWWIAGILLIVATVALFWASIRWFKRGRMYQPGDDIHSGGLPPA